MKRFILDQVFRYLGSFWFGSAIAILVLAFVLIGSYQYASISRVTEGADRLNTSLATAFSNSVWERVAIYVNQVSDTSPETLRRRLETATIHEEILRLTHGSPVLKIKIYDLDGLTVYSSDAREIGELKVDSQAFSDAVNRGVASSKFSYRGSFSAFSGEKFGVAVVETYVPVRRGEGPPEAVFEVYADVSSVRAHAVADVKLFALILFSVLLVFYAGLIVLNRRSNRAAEALELRNCALEHAGDAAIWLDQDGRVNYANVSTSRMLGYSHEELLNFYVTDYDPDTSLEAFKLAWERLEPDGSSIFETRHRTKNREFVPVEVSIHLLQRGTTTLLISYSRDITERKRSEQVKDELISTVSHEQRTPLTSIGGALGLLAGGAAGAIPADAMRLIEIAKNNSDRLVRLINDILDLERIESGKMLVRREPVQLSDALNGAVVENQGLGESNSVALRLLAVDPEIVVVADPDRLAQVMANLLSNATKFSPDDGTVEISTWRRGENVRVGVSDRGPGIPQVFQKHIFEKFSQVDATTSRDHQGTGLGLSIVKALVEGMGGRVGFESIPGEVTTFYFDLPLWHLEMESGGENIVTLDRVRGRTSA